MVVAPPRRAAMAYKTIVVHCDAHKTVDRQLDVAAELTDRFGGHLVGLYARRPFDAPTYYTVEVPMGPLFETYEREADAEQAAARAAFERSIKGKHLRTEW